MKKLMLCVLLMILCGNLLVSVADGGETMTLEEAVAAPGTHVYVKQGNVCVEADLVHTYYSDIVLNKNAYEIVSLDRTIQELIIVDDSSNMDDYVTVFPVVSCLYCVPVEIEISSGKVVYDYTDALTSDMKYFHEIDGYDVSGLQRGGWINWVYAQDDYRSSVIVSNQPVSINIGEYVGTHYHEKRVDLDSLYLIRDSSNSCDYIKTKLGYFVIDVSALQPGLYEIATGRDNFAIHIIQ